MLSTQKYKTNSQLVANCERADFLLLALFEFALLLKRTKPDHHALHKPDSFLKHS